MTQIPIYRAKKIDSDEYAYGCLVIADDYDTDESEYQRVYFIMHKMENYRTNKVWDFVCNSRIDPSTLAIHFPDMLDSQGYKIFASLSEDGKGGDKIIKESTITPVIYKDCSIKSRYLDCRLNKDILKEFKIIGVQQ